jgi:hypothetical protein
MAYLKEDQHLSDFDLMEPMKLAKKSLVKNGIICSKIVHGFEEALGLTHANNIYAI